MTNDPFPSVPPRTGVTGRAGMTPSPPMHNPEKQAMTRRTIYLAMIAALLGTAFPRTFAGRLAAQQDVPVQRREQAAQQIDKVARQSDPTAPQDWPAVQQDVLTLTRGRVTAILDTFSGRFAVSSADGKKLLFASGVRLTSHISVAVDGTIWTNYGKSQMYAPYPHRNLGRGRAETLGDRLRYTWEVRGRSGPVRIALELEPVADSLYEEVRVHLIAENLGTRAIETGMTVMEDVDADGDDRVRLRDGTTVYARERSFTGSELPERLLLQSGAWHPDTAHCRFLGHALTAPDILTVGRWFYHSGLGTAVYGYAASPQPIVDAAVLTQWNSRALAPGARREEITAIGFTAPLPEAEGTSTFAYELIVPMMDITKLVSIVSDSTTTVHVVAAYTDAWYEEPGSRNGYWDTTVTVTPTTPATVFVWLYPPQRQDVDSVRWYRKYSLKLRSDREIAAIARPLTDDFNYDASTVWPEKAWDTEYLFHGIFTNAVCVAKLGGASNRISIHPSKEYYCATYTVRFDLVYQSRFPADIPIIYDLPGDGAFLFEKDWGSWHVFNHWNTPIIFERDSSFDGAGDMVCGTQPFALTVYTICKLFPGSSRGETWNDPKYQSHNTRHPTRSQLGTEYIFVPFRKPGLALQDDLLRIIAYEDGTELTLFDGSPPLRLNRQEHVDTLLDAPTVIRSNKPVAVYQHHLACDYLRTDSTYHGGAITLLPHGLWGRTYYAVDDDATTLAPDHLLLTIYPQLLFYDHYLILITKTEHRGDISIDGIPVDASRFTVFGNWAYAYVDVSPGFHRVTGGHRFLTISCGGGSGPMGKWWNNFGFSYIPPFK